MGKQSRETVSLRLTVIGWPHHGLGAHWFPDNHHAVANFQHVVDLGHKYRE